MASEEDRQRLANPDLGFVIEPTLNAELKANGVTQERVNAQLRAMLEKQFNAPLPKMPDGRL